MDSGIGTRTAGNAPSGAGEFPNGFGAGTELDRFSRIST
jgi:hypothetical protein